MIAYITVRCTRCMLAVEAEVRRSKTPRLLRHKDAAGAVCPGTECESVDAQAKREATARERAEYAAKGLQTWPMPAPPLDGPRRRR